MIKKMIAIMLTLVVMIYCSSLGSALERIEVPQASGSEITLSLTAGTHGVYYYNEETDTIEYMDASEYAPELLPCESLVVTDEDIQFISDLLSSSTYEPRTKVTSPSGVQLSTCLIGSRFQTAASGESIYEHVAAGTGWLLNNQYVVTAGHMVYNYDYRFNGNNGYILNAGVYIGPSNGGAVQYRNGSFFACGGDFVAHWSEYETKGMFDDWGVIKLASPVTASVTKCVPHAVNSVSSMSGYTYYTQGYPCDLDNLNFIDSNGDYHWNQAYMYSESGTITTGIPQQTFGMGSPDYLILGGSTNLKLSSGQSGSPLYRKVGTVNYAEGIAIGQYNGLNSFILINSWLYNYLTSNCV